MAIINPRKLFKFRVTIIGVAIESMYVQDVKLPDNDITADKHGEGNTSIKTAGLVEVTNATFERVLPTSNTANAAESLSGQIWEWANMCQDSMTGAGADPDLYKRVVMVEELANDGVTAIDVWYLHGGWPTKINGRAFKRGESGNRVESFELAVDRVGLNAEAIPGI